jgi:hypothetical protein
LHARVVTKSGNGIEQFEPVTDCSDAKLLQDLVRQARQDRLVNLILAECRLILSEAQAPSQTTMSMTARLQSGAGTSSFAWTGMSRTCLSVIDSDANIDVLFTDTDSWQGRSPERPGVAVKDFTASIARTAMGGHEAGHPVLVRATAIEPGSKSA